MKTLLILPPMTQVNTPYPSTAYLTGYLRSRGHSVDQRDLGLELFYRLVSPEGLTRLHNELLSASSMQARIVDRRLAHFFSNFERVKDLTDTVIGFLRGNDPVLAVRIARGDLLPQSLSRQSECKKPAVRSAIERLSIMDKAMQLCGFFLLDIWLAYQYIDEEFEFTRYGESIVSAAIGFQNVYEKLQKVTLLDRIVCEITSQWMEELSPNLVGLSVPFPGNLYSALRIGKWIRSEFPQIRVAVGGGFCNTSLRSLEDGRLFEFVDFMCLDDGERPLEALIECLSGKRPRNQLIRTFVLENSRPVYIDSRSTSDNVSPRDGGIPIFDGLPIKNYIPQVFATVRLNPLGALINTYFWNKLTLAHGCYWKKCTFCDISLDYISRYEPDTILHIGESICSQIKETGSRAFHFVDEACPPSLLGRLSDWLIDSNVRIHWYGNIRFEKAFDDALASKMATAGCLMVTGGLEVASDRILKLMKKGTTIAQVASACRSFRRANILVHGYLIYGFPTQTLQEVIDSLEIVRQLFKLDLMNSAVWHRFGATIHSPIGENPEKFGIQMLTVNREQLSHGIFSHYAVPHKDSTGLNLNDLGPGLAAAVSSYMVGYGLKRSLRSWFRCPVPDTALAPDFVGKLFLEEKAPLFRFPRPPVVQNSPDSLPA